VFFKRGRDKVKVLWYDRHGWWLMYKRLERGRFASVPSGALSDLELRLVLEGVDCCRSLKIDQENGVLLVEN
jgi:hypothetical protein